MLNAKRRLQDRDRDNKVGSKNEVLFPINAETVRAELLSQDVECSCYVFGVLMDDVEISIGFD